MSHAVTNTINRHLRLGCLARGMVKYASSLRGLITTNSPSLIDRYAREHLIPINQTPKSDPGDGNPFVTNSPSLVDQYARNNPLPKSKPLEFTTSHRSALDHAPSGANPSVVAADPKLPVLTSPITKKASTMLSLSSPLSRRLFLLGAERGMLKMATSIPSIPTLPGMPAPPAPRFNYGTAGASIPSPLQAGGNRLTSFASPQLAGSPTAAAVMPAPSPMTQTSAPVAAPAATSGQSMIPSKNPTPNPLGGLNPTAAGSTGAAVMASPSPATTPSPAPQPPAPAPVTNPNLRGPVGDPNLRADIAATRSRQAGGDYSGGPNAQTPNAPDGHAAWAAQNKNPYMSSAMSPSAAKLAPLPVTKDPVSAQAQTQLNTLGGRTSTPTPALPQKAPGPQDYVQSVTDRMQAGVAAGIKQHGPGTAKTPYGSQAIRDRYSI